MKIIKKFKKLSKRNKTLLIVGLVIIIILINQTAEKKEKKITYKRELVKKGKVVSTVSETGEILTTGKVNINSTITGMVEDVYIKNGDIVKNGQSLFKVKSTASQAEKTTAYSTYLGAKNALESAKSVQHSLQSTSFSANQKFINDAVARDLLENDPTYIQQRADWLAAEANYLNQVQIIKKAQVALNAAWLNYQAVTSGTIKAPIKGTIANLAVSIGQEVNSNTIALMIRNDSNSWAKLAVSESDISNIEVGQKATVLIDALKGIEIEGTVDRVDDIGTDTSGIITYGVYINLGQVEKKIKAGMTVQIDIETKRVENVLVVSNSAVKTYQGEKTVQVLDKESGGLLYIPVKIGIVGDSKTEILNGISEGDEIIIGQTTSSTKNSSDKKGMFTMGRVK
ncbi:hypothetical protein DRH14_01655 [Candidatus Shapirobacteria bacterium]|nr:MAG: hypothetical protein DRH14_01655 [Candidatus Shapirobacteria bacterium]